MSKRGWKTNITFDRDEILKREDARLYDFNEVRRMRNSQKIYEVLIKELFEAGCMYGANYFIKLVLKEDQLIKDRIITKRVFDDPSFMMQIFNNIKDAEISAELNTVDGHLVQLKLLYQTALLIESKEDDFDWLVLHYYDMVYTILSKLNPDEIMYNEIRVRFFYSYGSYLFKKDEELEFTIEILFNANKICADQSYKPNTEPEVTQFKYLHEAVVRKLGSAILKYAKKFISTNAEHSRWLALDAILVIAQVGVEKQKLLLCQAYIDYITFMIEGQKNELALKQLNRVSFQIHKEDRCEFFPVKAQLFYLKGVCNYNLSNYKEATNKLQKALAISRKYDVKDLEGLILLQMGKVFSMNPANQMQSREVFLKARVILTKQKDDLNKNKADYLLSSLKAYQIFPQFLKLMQSRAYCHFYQLRQWKNQCKPFWTEVPPTTLLYTDDELISTSSPSRLHGLDISNTVLNERNDITRLTKMSVSMERVERDVVLLKASSKPTFQNVNFAANWMCLTKEFRTYTTRPINLKYKNLHRLRQTIIPRRATRT